MYDTDQSGTIDFTEFMILYHIMNDGSPEEVSSNWEWISEVEG